MLENRFSFKRFSRLTMLRSLAMSVFAVLVAASFAMAQGLNTVYVDVTNGSNTYTGANPTNSPAGTGPKATIDAGLTALANNGTLVIAAGTYNGGDNAGGNIDISTANYANLTSGLTIQLKTLNSNTIVSLTAGTFTFEVNAGTLTFTEASGTESIQIATGVMTLGSATGPISSNVSIGVSSAVQLTNANDLITMHASSAFTNQAPSIGGNNVSLVYSDNGNVNAGPEANYGSYGTGTISVSKTSGTSVTFPYAISKIGGITINGGNATFGQSVAMGTNQILNAGTGTVTFSAPVNLNVATGAEGSVFNQVAGNITFNGAVTWSANGVGAQALGGFMAENGSSGNLVFNSTVTLSNPGGGTQTVTASNDAAGVLTIGNVSETNFTLNIVNNNASGTLNLAGGTIGGLSNNGGANTDVANITGPLTITGQLTNSGTVNLGANTVTLSGTGIGHTDNGTITSSSVGGFSVTGAAVTLAGTGKLPNVTIASLSVTTFTGTLTAANVLVTGEMDVPNGAIIGVQSLTETGNIVLGGGASGELDVAGDFNRTSGTFTAGTGSLLKFNGTTAQAVNSGPNFQVASLEFLNTHATITLGASIRVSGGVTIDASTNVALSTLNIILNAAGASMNNLGSYTATGGGGVILGGANIVSGGVAANGITIGGSGTYSYITVDVGSGNTANVTSNADFNGVLTLNSGTLQVNATFDFSPTGNSASVIRNVVPGNGAFLAAGGAFGTFDAANVKYDLTYIGNLPGPLSVATGTTEFNAANVRTLTISTTTSILTLTSSTAVTINGALNLSKNALFAFDGVAPYNVTIDSSLNVATGAVLSGGSAANTITLAGNNDTSTVAGTITCASLLTVTGTGDVLNGSGITTDANTIANLDFEPTANGSTFMSNNLEAITGNVTIENTSVATGASATIAMNSVNAALTGNLTVGNAGASPTASVSIMGSTISNHTGNVVVVGGILTYTRGGNSDVLNGTVTMTGGTLTLGSNLEVTGQTTQGAGNLAIASFNYTQDGLGGANDYNRTGAGTVTGTGALVLNASALNTVTLTPGTSLTVPNLVFKSAGAAVLVNNSVTVSGAITHTSGNVSIVAGTLTLSGPTYTAASTAGTVAGAVAMTDSIATVTAALNYTLATGLTVNSKGSVTFASNNATARTFTVTTLTQTAGGINLGINNLQIIGGVGAFTRAAGGWTMSSGALQFNNASLTFSPGKGFAVDNLDIMANASKATTDTFTVNKYLTLGGSLTIGTTGSLAMGDSSTIERQGNADALDKALIFGATSINLIYSTAATPTINSGFEVPSTNIITNVTVSTGGAGVALQKSLQVNGTLTLADPLYATTGNGAASGVKVTMASGATLVLQINGTTALDQNLTTLGPINIVYDGASSTSTRELGSISGGSHTAVTSNVTVQTTVKLDAGLTVGGVLTLQGGNLDINGSPLTVLSDVVQSAGAGFFVNSAVGAAPVTFGGSANTMLTLKANQTVPALVNITIGKTYADRSVTISGGNLDFATNAATLYLDKGVLATGSNMVLLAQSNNSSQPTQGFVKTDTSYIYGTVSKLLPYNAPLTVSNVQYPVGNNPMDSTGAAYRPMTLFFTQALPSGVNLAVTFVDRSPTGSNGFPIADGSQQLSGYPSFYWYLKPDISFSNAYVYNLDGQAQGYAGYTPSQIQNLRFIARDSGSVANPWTMLGTDANYQNATLADGSPDIRVSGVTGHISLNGTIFTYGQPNVAPPALTVSGTVLYDKTGAPFSGATVKITPTAGGTAYTGTTNASGAYSVANVPTGTYTVTATTSAAWGGPNATQALLVVKDFLGTYHPDALQALAADVNNSGSADATDALLIVRRWAGLTNSFAKGDWIFTTDSVNVVTDTTMNISGIMTGDVNSSVTPASTVKGQKNTVASVSSSVDVNSDGVLNVSPSGSFEVPVTAASAMQVGAYSLQIKYPSEQVKFVGVTGPYADQAVVNAADGYVRIAWFDATGGKNPINLNANDELVSLKFSSPKPLDKNANLSFEVASGSALAGPSGEILNATLNMPGSVKASLPSKFALNQNYPNPFNPSTIIGYDLPVNGHVTLTIYDMLGQRVVELVNSNQNAGSYKVQWNASNMASGVYLYRISVTGGKQSFSQVHRMMLLK